MQGAFLHLHHTPQLQSKLRVAIQGLGGPEGSEDLVLQGNVVRLEPASGANAVGVDVVFTE
jgi:hypothetical protein